MDAKALYWTAALVNMAVLSGFALAGVRQIRRGEVARHQRSMRIAATLVVAFLVSYAIKLAVLGGEDLAVWSAVSRGTLYLHELCVLAMMIAGSGALLLGRSFRSTRAASDDPNAAEADPKRLARHRRFGRVAVHAALLGLLSAGFVLVGMYQRL